MGNSFQKTIRRKISLTVLLYMYLWNNGSKLMELSKHKKDKFKVFTKIVKFEVPEAGLEECFLWLEDFLMDFGLSVFLAESGP